jgi:3-dehydroquinate synthase
MNPRRIAPRRVSVRTPSKSYEILIGSGLLADAATWQGLHRPTQAVLVSNPTVFALHGPAALQALAPLAPRLSHVLLPDGEAHKDWTHLNQLFDHLLQQAADRKALLFALGGGVVGDMTGFAAACYMRGVRFVQLPTTLLAQVDSSVGGKTGINHPLGKNMIGAFHQPERVVCDLDWLHTLPERELKAGLAEVIKYAPIADAGLLDWLEDRLDDLLARDADALAHAVQRSCEIKAEVVGADERESGRRAILNFGHTFGHAIEAGLGYGEWLHGEAVACGMAIAATLSADLGLVEPAWAERLLRLLQRAGLPVEAPALPLERWFELMAVDKKAEGGDIRYVLLDAPGSACMRSAPRARVEAAIRRHGATAAPSRAAAPA